MWDSMTEEQQNAFIAEIMEPKPAATKTNKQLDDEDAAEPNGGNYTNWTITSPDGWWEINCDYHNMRSSMDDIPEWTPAKNPIEEIEMAFEVEEKIKEKKLQNKYAYALMDLVGWNIFYAIHATPAQRMRAAYMAVKEGAE